jgi:hypothetical protein
MVVVFTPRPEHHQMTLDFWWWLGNHIKWGAAKKDFENLA